MSICDDDAVVRVDRVMLHADDDGALRGPLCTRADSALALIAPSGSDRFLLPKSNLVGDGWEARRDQVRLVCNYTRPFRMRFVPGRSMRIELTPAAQVYPRIYGLANEQSDRTGAPHVERSAGRIHSRTIVRAAGTVWNDRHFLSDSKSARRARWILLRGPPGIPAVSSTRSTHLP